MNANGLAPFVRRLPVELVPDPSMVVLRPFQPGASPEDKPGQIPARIQRIVERVVKLQPADQRAELKAIMRHFRSRHVDVQSFFLRMYRITVLPHFAELLVTLDEQLLLGAYFAQEYSFQAAALFNPSIVPHPDQSSAKAGELRILMSLRAVGEGHLSSICFRTGTVTGEGSLQFDEPDAQAFIASGREAENDQVYVAVGEHSRLDEAVLFPTTSSQARGLEDMRLVKFDEPGQPAKYFGTYTAYDGHGIQSELLDTNDFLNLRMRPLSGDATLGKGMALFPRKIKGRYAMVGRQDHENMWLLYSDDISKWHGGEKIVTPDFPWEFVQIGNCGSPIETEAGWLLIYHGVGAVRNYHIGALLLDLDDPSKILGRTPEPIVSPPADEREGYVPNVVYSCGAIVHAGHVILPYAIADSVTTACSMRLTDLLAAMEPPSTSLKFARS